MNPDDVRVKPDLVSGAGVGSPRRLSASAQECIDIGASALELIVATQLVVVERPP